MLTEDPPIPPREGTLPPLRSLDLFPHAPVPLPVQLTPQPPAPRGLLQRAARRMATAFDPPADVALPRRAGAPAAAFWPVYARQRGLSTCEELWARDLVAPVLHGRASLRYAATLYGRMGDLDVLLCACTRRARRRGERDAAYLVLGTTLPWQAVADQRSDPERSRRIGWTVLRGQFAAWVEVPAIAPAKGEAAVPAVDDANVDWFCAQALGAATRCMVGPD